VGLFLHLRNEEDFAAWTKLIVIQEAIVALETRVVELLSLIQMAKKQCMVGIRRATFCRQRGIRVFLNLPPTPSVSG
jgi:hypothetical protein